MNYNKKIVFLVLVITITLSLLSLLEKLFGIKWEAINNVNILSNVLVDYPIKKDSLTKKKRSIPLPPPTTSKVDTNTVKAFTAFDLPNRFTSFYTDTSIITLNSFIQKLHDLKAGKKKKIRIAFFGDSMIEGDMITQNIRQYLQQEFGGSGVGFVPITSIVAGLRATVSHQFAYNWTQDDFKQTKHFNPLYLSGHTYYTSNSSYVAVEDKTQPITKTSLQKYVLTGHTYPSIILCNGKQKQIQPSQTFNRILLDSSNSKKLQIVVSDKNLPVYGISLESEFGVILDNFSFRGSSGIEFSKIENNFLSAINASQPYDLIVLQYGVNLLPKPYLQQFNWYLNPMLSVINKFKQTFPTADLLLISSADRAFRYPKGYASAIGLDSLIALQQKIAFQSGIAFYNLFASMGGKGSIVNWVNAKPPLAYKDYTHPTPYGSELLAKGIYGAICYEYNKQNRKK